MLLLLSIITYSSFGQDIPIDSLLNKLKTTKQDTQRINLLNTLAIQSLKSNTTKSISYAEEATQLSRKLNFKSGLINGDIIKARIYNYLLDFQKAHLHLEEAFIEINKTPNEKCKANYFIALGDLYKSEYKHDSSIMAYENGLKVMQEAKDFSGQILAHNNLGHLAFSTENYSKSIKYYLLALDIAQLNNFELEIANCNINIANVLNAQRDYKNAIQYLRKSLEIFKLKNKKFNLGVCYNNIAANYIDQDSLPKALTIIDSALSIYSELNDLKGKAACFTNKGILLSKLKEDKKAIVSYNEALAINEKLKDKNRIVACLSNMSISYLNLKNYSAVIQISEKGLKLANELKLLSAKSTFYENLSTTYDHLKDPQKAFYYYKLFKLTNDSINNAANRKEVLELEKKYNTKRKELEIKALTKDNQLKSVLIKKNKNLLISSIVIGLLGLILFFVFYRLYKIKLQASNLLENKNSKLEILNNTLKESEDKLLELNATKDKFFTIIAHDIKNPLSSFLSITKFLSSSYHTISEQQKIEYMQRIHKSSEGLYNLFQNLLQWSTSQAGNIKYKPVEVDLGIIIFKAITLLEEYAQKKYIQIKLEVDTGTYAYADINTTSIVIQNLISNAIKFSNEKSDIRIYAEQSTQYITISIEDKGIGIEPADLDMLFKVEYDHKTIGNSIEKGTGIGLILCKEFITRNGGEIGVKSEFKKGSTFFFTLPKK